jgi:NitT/TauT family transport system permease protein
MATETPPDVRISTTKERRHEREADAPATVDDARLREITGLDALDLAAGPAANRAGRLVRAVVPKLLAVVLLVVTWQLLVWSGWKDESVLPGPGKTFSQLGDIVGDGGFWEGVTRTLKRALIGYGISVLVGAVVGLAVARVRLLRDAIGSLITGLQTMPTVVWFPFAILLFQLSETAITFVVVLGAAPSIANGIIAGVDYVPPQLVRAGRAMGAGRIGLWRHVIIPAALPSSFAGLKQGWAFAWRSLMAGELLVQIPGHTSLGGDLHLAQEFSQVDALLAYMILILVIGVLVDSIFAFGDKRMRERRGMFGVDA